MTKIILKRLLFLFVLASCTTEEDTSLNTSEKQLEDPLENEQWDLVLKEDFDSNLDNWNIWEGGAFNNEIQLYRKQQLELSNGILTIKANRIDITGPKDKFNPTVFKDFSYVSGRIESKQSFGPSDKEGENIYRIVSRIKLPKGHGMWSAFWMYKDPWPTLGEIDIFEARGNSPRLFQSNIFYGSTVGKSSLKQVNTKKTYKVTADLTADFHEYELIWQKSGIEINLDGNKLGVYSASVLNGLNSFYGSKQHIVLNLAVGGVFFTDKNSENYADSAEIQVDWVKVYKK